jgi:flagellar hook-associated protein 2
MTISSLSSATVQSQISQYETRLQAPITQLKSQITTETTQISAWGTIQGTISSLSKSLSGISDLSTLSSRSAASTSSSVATVKANNSATIGTYTLSNVHKAAAETIYTGLKSSASASIGASAGSLTFVQNGKTESISVGSGSLTLNGVAAAINKAGDGVSASIVTSSTGARLVLQSSTTGSSQAFTVSGTGALAAFDYNPTGSATTSGSWTVAQKAADATLKVNGVPVTNATNSLADTIKGLTITLAGSGSTTLSVSSSTSGLTSALSSVATSLNSAISGIASEIKYTAATGSGSGAKAASAGPLLGNFTATNLSNQLVSAISGAAASGVSANAIGLTVSSTGAVSFDSGTFSQAYASNPTGVQKLVSQIYTSLTSITKDAIGGTKSGSGSGSIGAQTTSLNAQVTSINSEIQQITKQNSANLQNLINEYTLAETKSSSASITQAYLNIFLSTSGSSTG